MIHIWKIITKSGLQYENENKLRVHQGIRDSTLEEH